MNKFDNNFDENKMDQNLDVAKGILYAGEVSDKVKEEMKLDEAINEGKRILKDSSREQINLVQDQIAATIGNPEKIKETGDWLKREYKWTDPSAMPCLE